MTGATANRILVPTLLLAAQWILFGPLVGNGSLHAQESRTLPAVLEDLYLVLVPVAEGHGPLRLQVNSGGPSLLFEEAAERMGVLSPESSPPEASLPRFREDAWIPGLEAGADAPARIPVGPGGGGPLNLDGLLGVDWLRGRTWTFDYPGRALLVRAPGDLPLHGPDERMDLILDQEDAGGAAIPVIRIQGAGLAMTAAIHTMSGAELTDEAVAAVGDLRPGRRAISRLAASRFDDWRERHPDWRVVEGAEVGTGEAIMEIRGLVIGSVELPPLWVLRTPDEEVEARLEAPVSGPVAILLGGDVLREFRVTLDFVGGVAVFEPAGFP
jgi:hypothetical protein